jgi:uncharacterized membrane protein (DUF4010 family)
MIAGDGGGMDQIELFERLGLALAIGLLIGIERGWKEREAVEDKFAAGMRTLALAGLLGGVLAAMVPAAGPLPLALGFAVYGAIIAAWRWRESVRDDTYGATTVLAGLLAFALGAFAVLGDMAAAAAAAVAATLLLALKSALHGWLKQLTWEELRAGLLLAAMTFLALPILPDRGLGPWQAINPYEIWLLTILIAAVSFIGYVAVKVAGHERGFLIGGAVGGLVASTAVTLSFSRLARQHPENARSIVAGAVLAGGVMMARVLVVATLLNRGLLPHLGPALVGGALGGGIAAWLLARRQIATAGTTPPLDLRNPFDFWMAVRFGALLAAVFLAAEAVQSVAGEAGLMVLAAVSGIGDVDAITLSMARLAPGDIALTTAAAAILVTVGVNTLAKTVFGWVAGGRAAGIPLTIGAGASFAGAAAGFFLARLFLASAPA